MSRLHLRLVALVFVLAHVASSLSGSETSFDRWADGFAERWARLSPEFTSRVQYFPAAEQDTLDRQLSLIGSWHDVFGARAHARRAALAREGLVALQGFPRERLTPTQRVSAALIAWALQDALRAAEFGRHGFVFTQQIGLQLEFLDFLTKTHPIRRARDAENYLERLRQVADRLDEGIAESRAAAAAGILPPRFILERTIQQIDGVLGAAPAGNAFVVTLGQRIDALGGTVTPEARAAFVQAAERIVVESVLPAYTRVRTLLADQFKIATDDAGSWRLPRGAEYYQAALNTFTTTGLTPGEIHDIGRRETARIEHEMDVLLRQLGYTEGTVRARALELGRDASGSTGADPRAEALARYESMVRDAERRSAELFDLRPQARVEVRRIPAYAERTSAAHYTNPAPDGSMPGIFWVPLPGPDFGVSRTLAYHEAVPGHHFQLALQQEMKDLPRWRALGVFGFISAYGEGWGLYAERLADEHGWYEGDPRGRVRYLGSMLFRARRLVVDTGLHAKRWTRQQAIDYGISAREVERYVANPGQACSYTIGQLRIVELREKARRELGPRFALKQFHDVVLRPGNIPLDVLEQEVDDWIAAARK